MADIVEDFIPVSGTSDVLDTTLVTHEDGTEAHREGVFIGDPAVAAARVSVHKPVNSDKYSIGTEDKRLDSVIDLLGDLVAEQKITNILLEGLNQ